MKRLMFAIALAGTSVMVASDNANGQPKGQPTRRDKLKKNEKLEQGKWLITTNSTGESYGVVLQGDGNFVLYDDAKNPTAGHAKWSSRKTWPRTPPAVIIDFQSDGNLVAKDKDGHEVWSSHTEAAARADGKGGEYAWVKDGRFEIYSADNTLLWWKPSK
jgi:hypothetical protein